MIKTHPDIIHNKYFSLYIKLVSTADSTEYTENHHILPESMNGPNIPENMIRISGRKHFLAHFLLTKCTKKNSSSWHSMIKAFNMMGVFSKSNSNRYMNSRLYESNKKNFAESMRQTNLGDNNPQYGKVWLHNPMLDVDERFYSTQIHIAIDNGWQVGRKSSAFMKKIKSNHTPGALQIQGLTIKVHKDGVIITTKELYFYRDYAMDGWKKLFGLSNNSQDPTNSGKVRIKEIGGYQNLMLQSTIAKEFVNSGRWEYGYHYNCKNKN